MEDGGCFALGQVLIDRSPEAYERAERGEEKSVLGRETVKVTE